MLDTLEALIGELVKRGPARVLVKPGMAVSWRNAKLKYEVDPAIIFIRKDGWTIGAPADAELIKEASMLWREEYAHFLLVKDKKLRSIDTFDPEMIAELGITEAATEDAVTDEDPEIENGDRAL